MVVVNISKIEPLCASHPRYICNLEIFQLVEFDWFQKDSVGKMRVQCLYF